MRLFVVELGLFLWAVIAHWQSYVTGGVVTAVVNVYERKRGKVLTWKQYASIFLIAGGLVAVFYAWHDEHHKVTVLIAEKADAWSQYNRCSAADRDKDGEIRALSAQCYYPDRKLTDEQRDALHRSLQVLAEKYDHPRLTLGFPTGDKESQRFCLQLYNVFRNAGWIVPPPDKLLERPLRQKPTDPPDIGNGEGLSIQVKMGVGTVERSVRNQTAQQIAQAFNDAGVPMQTYDVDEYAKDLTVWVGIKHVDSLAWTGR